MSKVLVVVLCACQDVPNHLHPARPTATGQIPFAKSFQQSFGLIEPRRIGWGKQHLHPRRKVIEELSGIATDMTGAVVHNQMDAAGPTVGMKQASNSRPKMFAVVFIQTLCPWLVDSFLNEGGLAGKS